MRVVITTGQMSSFMGLSASEEDSENAYDHHRIGRGGCGSTEQEPTTLTLTARESDDQTGNPKDE